MPRIALQWFRRVPIRKHPDVPTSEENAKLDLGPLNYLWDEYKYRHGKCWEAVLKRFASVIALGVLPYTTKPELLGDLRYPLLLAPILGTLVAAYGHGIVENELDLFSRTKFAHNQVRRKTVRPPIVTEECSNA